MQIILRLNQLDTHAHVTVFTNGGNSDDLCFRPEDWRQFRDLVQAGAVHHGHFYKPAIVEYDEDEERWNKYLAILPAIRFPDMSAKQSVTFGKRSGLMILRGK